MTLRRLAAIIRTEMAVVTFGTGYVGKIDRVPGLFYLVTQVFQIVNVPLVPLGSFLVQEGSETQSFVAGLKTFDGAPTQLSLKSWGWAWVRAVWFAAALLGSIGALPLVLGQDGLPGYAYVSSMVASVVALVFWFRTRRGLTASRERALLLAEQLHISPDRVIQALTEPGIPKARVVE